MSHNTINWGIIGTGFIARKFAEDYHFVREGRILAVASRSPERAEAFGKKYGLPHCYGNYESLFQNPEIDAVYIATPHSEHYPHTIQALKHDKAVLCEKPAAVNTKELQAMIDLARSKDLLFMEAMWTSFLPAIQKARQWIEDGNIGQVRFIQASFGAHSETNPIHRLYNPRLAGGALLDLGIYPLNFSNTMAADPISEISAKGILGETGVDETTALLVRYHHGTIAQLNCSIKHTTDHTGMIYGTKGHIEIPDFWRASKAILYRDSQQTPFQDERPSTGYHFEIDEMNRLLLENKKTSALVPPAKSLTNMEILDECRRQIGLVYPFEC